MKSYPSISHEISDVPIIAFDKLDGSNIRAEWSKKRGFYKFGTRNRLMDETDPVLGSAKGMVLSKYEADLAAIATDHRWESAVFFFEYWGELSFAGQHVLADQTRTVTLIDVDVYRQGILSAPEFVKTFDGLETPKILFEGTVNAEFIQAVKDGTLDNMSFEGVVCKGRRPTKKGHLPLMFKIKSNPWLDKLRAHCHGDERLFRQLM